jgi:large subunit ribosomal protein L25
MSKPIKLMITKREKGSKGAMNRLRKEGFVPGSISQKGGEAISFSVRKDEFKKALSAHGMSSVYSLQADKKTSYTAMVREVQLAPVSLEWLHVTFQLVSLTEETTADISLHLKGRDELLHKGFELLQQLESVQLKGLPGDFPASIDIDVSKMEPGAQVTIADLKLPKGTVSLTEPDRLVLTVSHPKLKVEEPAEAPETPVEENTKPAEGEVPPLPVVDKGGKKAK